MPRSKKDVMLEKATPEKILESYYSQCHCWGDQYGGCGPCDLCKGQRIALVQLEKMREELAKYKAAHAFHDEMSPFKESPSLKRQEKPKKPSRERSLDDVTPEEWDEASKKVQEMTEARGGSARCLECGGDGISEHPHSGSRGECDVCDGTGLSAYGRTETRKLCQTLTRLADKRTRARKTGAREREEAASETALEVDLEADLGTALAALTEDKVNCWRCEGSGSEVVWAENNHGFSETCITCKGTGVKEPESVRTASRKSESQS